MVRMTALLGLLVSLQLRLLFVLQVLRSEPGNLIVSPMSASAALALVLQGAGGRTAQQLQAALRLPADGDVIKDGFKELFVGLESNNATIVRIANKVYTKTGATIKAPFRSTAVDKFRADAQELDFVHDNEASRQTINRWVEQITDNKIRELLKKLDPSTLMVVVNAIYFKGSWEKPFADGETRNEPFHVSASSQVSVPMMHVTSHFRYAVLPELGARLLELPYQGRTMKMWVILPDEVDGLARVEAGLTSLNFSAINRQMSSGELGVQDLFGPGANLSGITDLSVSVSQVIQKAFVEVTEEGTVAAAATAVEIVNRYGFEPDIWFRVNRPFAFFVLCEDFIFFCGRIQKPVLESVSIENGIKKIKFKSETEYLES
ncbi:Serine protease inhibitor 42Dd [Gryllus bimaculatus]|nr:Serine protease inhibitor 42Dd [Gryllus bimaculatus]